jgi:Flp pilus assembly protein TadG
VTNHGATAARPTRPPARWPAPRCDAGSSALELVLLTPALIALVFALIQTALVWNAKHTVGAAAQHGARLARTETALAPNVLAAADAGAGAAVRTRASTLRFLQQIGGQALRDPSVSIGRDGPYVTVTVSGTTVGVLPGTTVRVTGSSRSPIEGFRP